jgi:hypothetical protein
MIRIAKFAVPAVLCVAVAAGLAVWAQPRGDARDAPRLVPVAETRLLMEGLNFPNFRGLEKLLKDKPREKEAWVFARGQALLIAETGNLLLLRPPRSKAAVQAWQTRVTSLRTAATQLARTLANKDFDGARKDLTALANACNACHKQFRVATRIVPFAQKDQDEDDEEGG